MNSVKSVVAITPISMMVLRLTWSDTAENAKPLTHSIKAGPLASHFWSASVSCSGALASTSSWLVIDRSYPSIKPTRASTAIIAT